MNLRGSSRLLELQKSNHLLEQDEEPAEEEAHRTPPHALLPAENDSARLTMIHGKPMSSRQLNTARDLDEYD